MHKVDEQTKIMLLSLLSRISDQKPHLNDHFHFRMKGFWEPGILDLRAE